MKQVVTIVLGLVIIQQTHGQALKKDSISNWEMSLAVDANLNQAAFSNNWKGGGATSIGLNAQLKGQVNYTKNRHNWNNELDLLFGFVYRKGAGYQKTVDRIYIDSKYSLTLTKKWAIFTSLNFLTQFAKGYDNEDPQHLISEFMAPAYITSAWGALYHPVEYFKVSISPFAPRATIVKDPERFIKTVGAKPYGVDSNRNTRLEWLAFQMVAEFNKNLTETINLQWRYLLYINYETIDIKQWDHRLDLTLKAKVWKYINVTLGGILLYDYDQDKGVQLNQLFTLGLSYTITNIEGAKK